ncbi:MAG: hypothetical protein HY231_13680 [Acidobacteria bacterium]|nr:hypothetical protein [Acidobacteriota bacterium]
MKKIIITGIALMALVSVTAVAFTTMAQGRDLRGTATGRGTLKYAGERDANLSDATVFLKRNGDIEIRLNGTRFNDSYTFTGHWYEGRNNDYEFDLTDGFGTAGAVGKGRVSLRTNGQLLRLQFSGYSQRQAFSVNFDGNAATDNHPSFNNAPGNTDYAGTYRSSESTQRTNQDFTIIRVLRIKADGTAELVSRFKGGEPLVNRENLSKYGNLLSDIRDRKTVLHVGNWRNSGRGIEVTLRTLDPEERNDKVTATLRLEFRGNDRDQLQTVNWDRQLYGNTAFQFVRVTEEDRDDSYQRPADNSSRPATERLNLADDGDGTLSIGRDAQRFIKKASVSSAYNDTVEIRFTLSDGNVMRFAGNLVKADNRRLDVRLTSSGDADASGNLIVEEASNGRIRRISGNGRLDSRTFTVDFQGGNVAPANKLPNDRDGINISQNGNGLWTREGWPNLNIESVSVITRSNQDADVSLRFSSGQRLVFSGKVETRNAYGLVLRITNSGNLNASGTLEVDYGRNNSITTLSGNGRLDGNRFTIQFSGR